MKPVINLDALTWRSHRQGEQFEAAGASASEPLGARQLGYRVTEVPPGKTAWPFHNHHANEEMFFILEGSGTLRHGAQRHPLRAGDFIAALAGDAGTAHQIVNDSDAPLRYLCVSTMLRPDITEYPDSGKFSASSGASGFGHIGRRADAVDYWDGEAADRPG